MAAASAAKLITFSLLVFLSLTTLVKSHNITKLLSTFPEYSSFNSYLTQTKLADEINSRQTITVLALNNAAMSALTSNHPLSAIKNALSLHVLLDYYDPSKLHQLSNGTTLSTSLYQTTGNAKGNLGFVNITDLSAGKVGFGSAAPGSKLDSVYSKSVKQIPYNISVVEITAPIIAPGVLNDTTLKAPSPAPVPSPAAEMAPSPGPVTAEAPSPMAASPAPVTMMTPDGAPSPAGEMMTPDGAPSPAGELMTPDGAPGQAEADKGTSGSGDVKVKGFELVFSVAAVSVVFSMLS